MAVELGLDPTVNDATVRALRDRLETFPQRRGREAHYSTHHDARPSLAEVAQAAAEVDGDSLAGQPALVARAAKEIVALRPNATVDDVLIYAAGLMFPGDRLATALATLVLDNEPVQALGDFNHPKHRRALAFVEVAPAVRSPAPTRVRRCSGRGEDRSWMGPEGACGRIAQFESAGPGTMSSTIRAPTGAQRFASNFMCQSSMPPSLEWP